MAADETPELMATAQLRSGDVQAFINHPVTKQRQVPPAQTVQKTVEKLHIEYVENPIHIENVVQFVEVPQVQHIDKFVDIAVTNQRRAPTTQTVKFAGEMPQIE